MHKAIATVEQASPIRPATEHGADKVVLEQFVYDDDIVRKFLIAMYVFGVVAFAVGVFVAFQLAFQTIPFTNIPSNFGLDFLTFGRLRPLHTNAAIFAFAGNAIFAGIYYSTQRLLKTRMWSDFLSRAHFWGWQLIIVAAAITLPAGFTQGKEYAELEWPIDLAIAVVWLGFFGTNFFMTLVKRRERHLYVAIWFYIATIVTVTILHIFNNLWVPLAAVALLSGESPANATEWLTSYSVYSGVQDAFMQWWYGHNAVAFFLTTPFLGLMYYFMPKAAERPVFSYRLSIVHFWSLVFIYIWAGPHHLHYSATPDWASTLGMVFSLMLLMPSWGGMINGLMTLRGAWHKVATDPVLKFFVVGVTFYGMSTFEGPMLSIKSVNGLSHFTDWTIAHVHSGALGWNGCLAFGMMYWLLPRLFQTKLWSTKLATYHFWLWTIGILMYIIPIYVAGITQGLMWRATNDLGQLTYPDFVETVRAILPMYHIRVLAGLMLLTAAVLGGINFLMTVMNRPKKYDEPIHQAPALAAIPIHDPVKPRSTLKAVTPMAKKIDVFTTLWWHRRWERLPMFFTVMVIGAVTVASLFEIIPTFLIRSDIPVIASVKPYSPLELEGRDVYISNGCYNCHSQVVRPILAEVKRYYPANMDGYSKPGEYIYDHPFQWGSRRIGPDLHREGGKQSDDWHFRHFMEPTVVTPGSIMPPYPWLAERKIDWKTIATRVKAMQYLGVPYTDLEYAESIDHAKKQAQTIAMNIARAQKLPTEERTQKLADELKDKQVVALIAYMQRLGRDVMNPDTPATPETK